MKKRLFNTAVALAAAMSLSTAAFAEVAPGASDPGVSGPGVSNPGWSDLGPGASNYEETIDLTGLAADAEVILGSDQGLAIEGKVKDFPAGVTKVTLVSSIGALKEEAAEAAKTPINNAAKKEAKKVTSVNYGISVTLKDQDGNVIEPVNKLTVHVNINSDNETSNLAAYISDDGNKVELFTLNKNTTKKIFNFKTNHFSKYYLVKTIDTGDGDDETTTTTAASGGGSGSGFGDPGTGNTTTTQAPAAGTTTTTTKAPADVTTKAPEAATTTKAPADGTTKAPADNTPDDGNNSNVGNDGNGNGPDKNQATGVVLAVIPAAIAATAVVISKKRK